MSIFSGLFRSRDKPTNSYDSPSYSYFFGRSNSGKRVSDRTAMQHTVVYACVRVLSEAIAQLPLHVYQYTENGKERVPVHTKSSLQEVRKNNLSFKQRQTASTKHNTFDEFDFIIYALNKSITEIT